MKINLAILAVAVSLFVSSAAAQAAKDVNVVNTPTVNVGNSPTVNVGNTPSVNVANTPTVNVGNTPTVSVGGTANTERVDDPPRQPYNALVQVAITTGE